MRTIVLCLTLQDIQTDTTQTIDVGVIDLGQEADFGWGHRIIVWQEEFKSEDTTCIKSVSTSIRHEDLVTASLPSYGDCAGP